MAWAYAFRFLRASLSLRLNTNQETLIALSQLKATASLANGRGDHAVAATASVLESLIHVHRSDTAENIEQAQRALAAVRSSQMRFESQIPQISIMALFVDLACSLVVTDTAQATAKLKVLQPLLDEAANDSAWSSHGRFPVPVTQSTARTLPSSGLASGIVRTDAEAGAYLQVPWIPKDEMLTIGYMLSAAVVIHKNARDGQKAEAYLKEAIRLCRGTAVMATKCIPSA